MIEGKKDRQVSLRLTAEMQERLDSLADASGASRNAVIRAALEAGLKVLEKDAGLPRTKPR